MLNLRQLFDRHASLLCLDACSERVHVGLLRKGAPARWASRAEGAGTGLFRALEDLGAQPMEVEAYVFCHGPGSILGVRTSAVAIRTWQVGQNRPAYAYTSLAVAGAAAEGFTVIADARRGLWHALAPGQGLTRVPVSELAGVLAMPEGFKSWAPPPPHLATLPYDPKSVFERLPETPFFSPVGEPDAFLHEEPSYATWTPQVHRSP